MSVHDSQAHTVTVANHTGYDLEYVFVSFFLPAGLELTGHSVLIDGLPVQYLIEIDHNIFDNLDAYRVVIDAPGNRMSKVSPGSNVEISFEVNSDDYDTCFHIAGMIADADNRPFFGFN